MSMKSKRNRNEDRLKAARRSSLNLSGQHKAYYVAALSALVLLAASVGATRFDPVRRTLGLRPLSVSPAQNQNLPLSKEYVYAGGRLVATEEPTPSATPTPTGPPPTNLVATAVSASNVSLTWTPPAGNVVGYVVERRSASGSQELTTGSANASFNDTTPSGDNAYLYRVKAVYAGGTSGYGNADLATTVVFTDSQLQGVTIKAIHLTELRRAVNAVRALAGISTAAWTYPDPVSSPPSQRRAIYLEDVTDLRARLDEATGALGLTTGYPASPALARGAVVSAQHFEQIRTRVR
jgi:hypothetical protein